jgi:hypothetical protein
MAWDVAPRALRAMTSLSGVIRAAFSWSCAVFIDLKKRFSKLKNSDNLENRKRPFAAKPL